MSDEINIKEMPTDELLELMGEDLYDGYAEEVVVITSYSIHYTKLYEDVTSVDGKVPGWMSLRS